jgi:hypothetical protein
MGRMSPQLMQHPLDTTWQSIFTFASWGIVLIMLAVALRKGRTESTPFYVIALVAAGLGAFAEPLYDVGFDLWFYDAHHNGTPGAMWSHFTAFGVVQPNWSHSGYIILYAMACLYAGRRLYEGRLTRANLFTIWGAEIAVSCVFEIIGTGTNVYTYYGPYELRLGHYPLVIGVLEGTQTVLFTVVAVQIWRRARTPWGLLGLIPVFPITMLGGNFGLGFPTVIALHLDEASFSSGIVWAGTFLSMALCAVVVNLASRFLPAPEGATQPAGDAPAPRARTAPAEAAVTA